MRSAASTCARQDAEIVNTDGEKMCWQHKTEESETYERASVALAASKMTNYSVVMN